MIRIFIAEDQTILRDALTSLIHLETDMNVIGQARTGKEVLASPIIQEVDVLLMDIEMPEGTGLETAAKLKDIGFNGKIALLTTFSRAGYIESAMRIGVNGYLLKDEAIEDLVDAYRRVYRGDTVISQALHQQLFQLQHNPLTEREQQLLSSILIGKTTEMMAKEHFLSIGTVRNYLSTAMQKLQTTNRFEAAQKANEKGWLTT
ncbi:LOW QUALITY PROTEIN: two-component response regulator [Bacillus sp. JCM 19047]|nr:LOW QUALITY PROTEIN: two-component response regulator [Bacillus sp. JCM 19047]